jgi:signal transduction histidine kinase
LQIEIYDTGPGIKNEDLNKLFNLFGKLDDPKSFNKEGTGLGLYISALLVD